MKKFYFLLLAICFFTGVNAQIITFPDANFKTKLLQAASTNTIAKNLAGNYFRIDSNYNNQIEVSEASQVSYLAVGNSSISSLQGISNFTNLQFLSCAGNYSLTTLNLAGLANLQSLYCNNNSLNSINLTGLVNLQILNCSQNVFSTLDVSSVPSLQTLTCNNNSMENLNVTGLINLQTLNCQQNLLQTLNLTGLTNLRNLDCSDNRFASELNLSTNLSLVTLNCSLNYNLPSFNVNGLTNLQDINCSNSGLTSVNLSSLSSLQKFNCRNNPLTSLNLSGLTNLNYVNCDFNQSLNALYLRNIGFDSNNPAHLLSFDTQLNLKYICADPSLIPYIQQKTTSYGYNSTYCLVITSACSLNPAGDSVVNIPDANFKNRLLYAGCYYNQNAKDLAGNFTRIDANYDGQIQAAEAAQISYLNVSSSTISSLEGISSFTNLRTLFCPQNQITSLNLSGLTSLQSAICFDNRLTSLNVSGLTNLTELSCATNQLPTLNVSGLTSLQKLYVDGNRLTTLNVSGLNNLQFLECYTNLLTSLNVAGLIYLQELWCGGNQISSLDVSGLRNLNYLNCANNRLTTIDASSLTSLNTLHCANNLLSTIFLKNGRNESTFTFNPNPTLEFICADDTQIASLLTQLASNGMGYCNVNSYCSFVPGGTYYTIQGNNKFDSNNNGCDAADLVMPNLKFAISSGATTGSMISNFTGSYSAPVLAGTHSITPTFENPTYFNASPSTVNVSFPAQTSPFTQNFCITANGIHNDLEVVLLPLNTARPGFDAKYKLIYKNKGNQTQSGSVNLAFNDAVLDLVSANPVVTSQTVNNLSWNFSNLKPFETREIALTLNLNSPMETPAVNAGYVLNYSSAVTSPGIDDLPNDNTFAYNQTVVNSFDPNDKTCLEGTTLSPSKVGDYVHYMIRFENNGTANAHNIVVKDIIDTAKFDINTLVPMKGSHSFVTNITAGNKVEFIFENINLPYDNANNDGFVAFKIKTKSTLVVGNTFSNSASIYFDYNFPIVTNTATTTIQTLNAQDFSFANYFMLYPNPVNDVLNIETKQTIEVSSISIYNQLGQVVLVVPSAQNVSKVDVSSLASGNYFIKINSDKGTSNTKFIKK
jgi:Leucine-rich repeat (LRR) protein